MAEVIKIREDIYKEIHHYSNRNSPWIKFHASIYKIYEFNRLPDGAKAHFLGLLLIANETRNCTVNDSKWLRTRLHAGRKFSLNPLIECGLIEIHEGEMLASSYQESSPNKKESKSKSKSKKESISTEPAKAVSSAVAMSFSYESQEFSGITEQDIGTWVEAYPAVDIKGNIKRAGVWLKSNPTKRKKNIRKYLTGWFSRTQERGGDKSGNKSKTGGDKYVAKD